MFPSTRNRVPNSTAATVNDEIRERAEASVVRYRTASREQIEARLRELDEEWDVERTLEANAASAMLIGLALAVKVDRRWLLLPAAVGGFLLQHALQGWCPPLPVFRRLGIRTSYEIDYERYALKMLRGDFGGVQEERSQDASQLIAAATR